MDDAKESEVMVEARGLACPQPVLLARKALAEHARIVVAVDDEAALENVKRMGASAGCQLDVEQLPDGSWRIHLQRASAGEPEATASATSPTACSTPAAAGPFVIVLSADTMGRGEDELGRILLRTFLHCLTEQQDIPDAVILYNTGVKLAARGSAVLGDLKNLQAAGVTLLVCGTCVKYFELTGEIDVGTVSNMYDIAGLLSRAARIVSP